VESQVKVVEVEFRPEAESTSFLPSKDFFHTGKHCLVVRLKVRRLVSGVKKD